MDDIDDPWHFPRPKLAEQYLNFFETGVSNALILFQRRRSGKTEFCLRDFAPLAEARDYTVAYVSFWQSRLAPTAVLLYAIEKSLERRSIGERVKQFLTTPVTKLKLSGELPGTKGVAEIELAEIDRKSNVDTLLYLADLLERAAKKAKGKYLLILDEAQELAAEPANESLVAALRTILDTNKRSIRVVFTGSSQEGLQRMFSSAAAPFFHFGTQIDLPVLGEDFVRHIARTFAKVSKRRINLSALTTAYQSLQANPFYLRKLTELILVQPTLSVSSALTVLRDKLAVEHGYPRLWESLKPVDRALVLWLTKGETQTFTQGARDFVAEVSGEADIKIHTVQSAIRRLVQGKVIRPLPSRGGYALEDSELGEWCLSLPLLPRR
jgi:hypothetical protein